MESSEIIRRILQKEITPREIMDEYLLLITSKGAKQPDETTTLDPALVDEVIDSLKIGWTAKVSCHYDEENNMYVRDVQYRKRVTTQKK